MLMGVCASSARSAEEKCYANQTSNELCQADVTSLGATIDFTILPNSTVGHGERTAKSL